MSKTADSGIDEQQRQANDADLLWDANEWRGPHTDPHTGEVYYRGDPGPELVNIPKRVTELKKLRERIDGGNWDTEELLAWVDELILKGSMSDIA